MHQERGGDYKLTVRTTRSMKSVWDIERKKSGRRDGEVPRSPVKRTMPCVFRVVADGLG
jgi:hypothetical protein